jgi:hypothetical protein
MNTKELKVLLKTHDRALAVSTMTAAEVLIRCAANGLITREQFEMSKTKIARGKNAAEIRAIAYPEGDSCSSLTEPAIKTKRTRPDVAQRLAESKFVDHDTVTWTWKNLCREPALALPIEETLLRVNKLAFEAYELANFHVHRSCRLGEEMKPLDQSFFNRCLNSVLDQRKQVFEDAGLEGSVAAYERSRPPLSAYSLISKEHMRPICQVLSRDMSTAVSNMIIAVFRRRFKAYIKKVLDCTPKQAWKTTDWIIGREMRTTTTDAFILRMRAKLPVVPSFSDTQLKKNSHLLMPLFKMFQRHATGKRFSILPHKNGFTCNFLTINTNTLRSLLLLAGQKVPAEMVFQRESDLWWRKLFKIEMLETRRRRFGREISTDGKSAKILMSKKVVRMDLFVSSSGYITVRLDPAPFSINDKTELLKNAVEVKGVDPGYRSVFTSWGIARDAEDPQRWTETKGQQFSAKQYYHEAKYRHTTKKINTWIQNNTSLQDDVKDIPTKHYESEFGCIERLQYVLPMLEKLLSFYGQKRFKNLKLLRHIHSKKALRKMCTELCSGRKNKRETILGVGDFGGAPGVGIKGECGPIGKLKKALPKYAVVLDINEDYTSQTCNNCHQRSLTNMRNEKWMRKKQVLAKNVTVHGVLHCSTSVCEGKTWDRDINAAKNMLELTMLLLRGWKRPAVFCRH